MFEEDNFEIDEEEGEENNKIYKYTNKFGNIYPEDKIFNHHRELGEKCLQYKPEKIIVWLGEKNKDLVVSGVEITYRNIIPEVQSEIPNTLDVIFSAFISTGALKEYRGDNDYIYITEAGLWSKSYYNNSGDNGLLAGYRIMPTDDEAADVGVQESFTGDGVTLAFTFEQTALSIVSVTVDNVIVTEYNLDSQTNQIVFIDPPANGANIIVVYKTTNSWKDMSKAENRLKVQENIIRIGTNQVAQIIWKLQLGGLEQLNGLRYIYPSQYPEEVWNVWSAT